MERLTCQAFIHLPFRKRLPSPEYPLHDQKSEDSVMPEGPAVSGQNPVNPFAISVRIQAIHP